MTASEVIVKMGELAATRTPGEQLVTIGLGSCIGLALVAARSRAVGLAHVMLPDAPAEPTDEPGRYADTAVPALLAELSALGVLRAELEAVLVGGARMFAFTASAGLDVGARNEAATRAALATAEIPVRAAATGGSVGRTVRVFVEDTAVQVRETGGTAQELYRGAAAEKRLTPERSR